MERAPDTASMPTPQTFTPVPAPAPVPLNEPADGSGPRFCRRCGQAWAADWTDCPRCAAKPKRSAERIVSERSGAISALILYSLLLLVSASVICFGQHSTDGPKLVIIASVIDSLIVLAWCAVRCKEILPLLRLPSHWVWFPIALGGALLTFGIASEALGVLHHLFAVPDAPMAAPFLAQATATLLSCC